MHSALDKDTIEMEVIPHMPLPKRGFPPTVPLVEMVNAILYKLKTGAQWHQLPAQVFFKEKSLCWESACYHYRKWCVTGAWKTCWIGVLDKHKSELDLSSVDLDGSHAPAIRGGEQVEHQGRKKRKTTNALYLSDRQGLPIAMSEPLAGNHNDLHDIEAQFEVAIGTLEQANISVDGLFLNADAGFDSKDFRASCSKKDINANVCFNKGNGNTDRDEYFGQDPYNQRYAIERTNAWDGQFSISTR